MVPPDHSGEERSQFYYSHVLDPVDARRAFPRPRRAGQSATSTLVRQHDHRPRRAEPRRAADERRRPSGRRRAAADLRLRLWRWRGWAVARRAPCRSQPGANVLFLTVDLCSLCLRVERSEHRDVRLGGAVRRWCGGGRAARARPARAGTAAGRRALARPASIWAAAPSTSWAGTSRTTASASCCAGTADADARHAGERCCVSRQERAATRGLRRVPVPSRRAQGAGDGGRTCWACGADDLRAFVGRAADFGNMSSATALFVLDEARRPGPGGICSRPSGRASRPISPSSTSRRPIDPSRRQGVLLELDLVAEHGRPHGSHDDAERVRAKSPRQEQRFDDGDGVVGMPEPSVRSAPDQRRVGERHDAVGPVAAKRADDPVAHELSASRARASARHGGRRRNEKNSDAIQARCVTATTG